MNPRAILLVTLAASAMGPPAGAQTGPGIDSEEAADELKSAVRQTLRTIRGGLTVARQVQTEAALLKAQLSARHLEAAESLKRCRARHAWDAVSLCRVQEAQAAAMETELRDGIIRTVEKAEEKFLPQARLIRRRVEEVLLSPARYRYLLRQTDRNSESRLLHLLMVTLEQIQKVEVKMNEAVTMGYLSDVLGILASLSKDIQHLEKATPEIGELLEQQRHAPPRQDSLAGLAYPSTGGTP